MGSFSRRSSRSTAIQPSATIDEYVYLSQPSKMEIDLELAEFSSRTIDKFNCIQMRITKTAIIATMATRGDAVCQSIAYRSIGTQTERLGLRGYASAMLAIVI